MDAAGLRVLIDARDNLSAAGGELSIGSQSPPVRRLLQVTGMAELAQPAPG